MKTISEIKTHAWDMLTERKWYGPIAVCFFTMLLSIIINLMSMIFETNSVIVTLGITFMLSVCIINPFAMGAKIYILEFVRGSEVTVGNVFDGYHYAIKLIPVTIINMIFSSLSFSSLELAIVNGGIFWSLLSVIVALLYLVVSVILNMSMYLIYDNDGKIIKSIKDMSYYLILKGGFVKLILLVLSYILWFVGIIISLGTLTFFVLPYMEAAKAVFYDDIYTFIRSGN